MAPFKKFNFVTLLLGAALYFATVTKAFHETVSVKINNGVEIIELNWKRTEQHLANRNLPVWYAEKHKEPRFIPQIFSKMGEFVMYHDVEKSSAVVFFPKLNYFYGVIDTRFYIRELPLKYNEPDIVYDVGGPYVFARKKNEEFFHDDQDISLPQLFTEDQIKYINSIIDSADKGSVPGISSRSSHQQQQNRGATSCPVQINQDEEDQVALQNFAERQISPSKILFPEILVFITNDIFTKFTKMNAQNGISLLLLYYITYFNAIDMILAKLATDDVAIHLNIAGLVIETENNVFPYTIREFYRHDLKTSVPRLYADELLHNFPGYIEKYQDTFVEDSFDFYFISTSYEMGHRLVPIHGKSSSPVDIYVFRALKKTYDKLLGSVVYRKGVLSDYVIASSEIAKLMNIRQDSGIAEAIMNQKPCHAIMQDRKTHCPSCLKWSKDSQRDLQNYIRLNTAHCFLLNNPRSLYPYSQPVMSLYPEDQCICYKYPRDTLNPFYIWNIPGNSCDKEIQCSNNQDASIHTPLPIDGTPCGSHNKVCWRKQCMAIGTSHNVDNSDAPHPKRLRLSTGSELK